ncbi:hypothetical protein GQ600_2640 [Phytophthora cactorum]|nr:hypothetical protein GQ600_2640 [Phytophthora cactorum]
MKATSSSGDIADSDNGLFVEFFLFGRKGVDLNISASPNSQAHNNAASGPREWGKRKLLVTRKRPKVAAMPSKRARRTSWEHSLEFFYQSSTGTDNFQEEKASARQQANGVSNDGYIQTQKEKSNVVTPEVKGEQQKTGKASKVVAVSQSEPRGDALQTNRYGTIMMTGALKTVGVGALSLAEQVNVDGEARVKKKNSSIVAALSKSVAEVHEVAGAEKNARAGNTKEKQNTKILTAAKLSKVESGRNNDKASIAEELRQVERNLEAGDDVCGLNVAKARFQAMLDALVRSMTEDYQTTELNTADTTGNVQATEDPIVNLCDPKHRSTDQTRLFKTRLRDAMAIIDAMLCNPPRGQSCSRDCKTIRAQLCNEFTPCNNPTCRAWHEVEAHIEACPSEQCELKNRVRLRETLHLSSTNSMRSLTLVQR